MERLDNLLQRDKVGVDDFVLLDHCDKDEFLANLRKRFKENIIYVSLYFEHFYCITSC